MPVVESFVGRDLHGFLHRPDAAGDMGLVLTHGAGSDCRAPLLVAAADAFVGAGVTVLRVDLSFRRKRPKGPPSPQGAAADRAGLRAAATALGELARGPIWLGGHSYGGRQATLLASEAPDLAHALLLLSYPLHPPKKPEQLRTQHFPRLRVPCVFVHGANDPFGSISELQAAVAQIPAPTTIIPIAAAGHDLRRGKLDWRPAINALLAAPRHRS